MPDCLLSNLGILRSTFGGYVTKITLTVHIPVQKHFAASVAFLSREPCRVGLIFGQTNLKITHCTLRWSNSHNLTPHQVAISRQIVERKARSWHIT